MSENNRLWVLGAPDPEMEMVETLLRECGETVIYAADARGERVHAGNAYQAARPPVSDDQYDYVYAVECGGDWFGALNVWSPRYDDEEPVLTGCIRIDHHRPGDPGYGRPPSEFLEASSIGQVISELARTGALRRVIPKEYEIARWMVNHRDLPVAKYNEMLRTQWFWSGREDMPGSNPYASDGTIARGVSWLYDGYAVAVHRNDFYFERRVALIPRTLICAAAADHCLGAAYRGECPGVDPDALMRWRAESRARFQGRQVDEVLSDMELTREAISRAPKLWIAGQFVVDLRDAYTVSTVLVEPFSEGASVDSAGVGDSKCIEFGDHVEGAWDEGSHHTFVRRGVAELPDAASREGVAYLAYVGSGRPKIVLGGCTTPEMVRAFLDHWAPAQGLVDAYGDPERGFAGAYYPTEDEAV